MTDDVNQLIMETRIGDDKTASLETAEQNRSAGIALISQARYRLDIVCRDLDHALYDNEACYEAVKNLATRSPKVEIRILIQNSDKLVKKGHRLVTLAQKLTSYIKIRLQGKRFKEFNEAWLIVDAKAWIRRPHADKYLAELDYSAARQLRERLEQFNAMWDESIDDPNLRRLSI